MQAIDLLGDVRDFFEIALGSDLYLIHVDYIVCLGSLDLAEKCCTNTSHM
jgi:hypothetical protein